MQQQGEATSLPPPPSPLTMDAGGGTALHVVTPVKPIDGLSRRWDVILVRAGVGVCAFVCVCVCVSEFNTSN